MIIIIMGQTLKEGVFLITQVKNYFSKSNHSHEYLMTTIMPLPPPPFLISVNESLQYDNINVLLRQLTHHHHCIQWKGA